MIDFKKVKEQSDKAIRDACALPDRYIIDDINKPRCSEKEYNRLLDFWWEKIFGGMQ